MGSVLCKLFYTILLSHKSGIVNTVFRFVSFRICVYDQLLLSNHILAASKLLYILVLSLRCDVCSAGY